MRQKSRKMFRSSPIYGSNALEISLQSDQKWNLQTGTNLCILKSTITAWNGETPVHFFVQLCRQNNSSDNYISVLLNHQFAVFRYPQRTRTNSGPDQIIWSAKLVQYLLHVGPGAVYISFQNWYQLLQYIIQDPYQVTFLFCLFIPKHLFTWWNISPWWINQTINQDQLTIHEPINQSISQNQSIINQPINQSINFICQWTTDR